MAINTNNVPTLGSVLRTREQTEKRIDTLVSEGKVDTLMQEGHKGLKTWTKERIADDGFSTKDAGWGMAAENMFKSATRAEAAGKDVAPLSVMFSNLGLGDTSVPLDKLVSDARKNGVLPAGSGVYANLALYKSYEAKATPAPGQPMTPEQQKFAEAAKGVEGCLRSEITALQAYHDGTLKPAPITNPQEAASMLLVNFDKIEKLGVDGKGTGSGDGNIGKGELEYAADPNNKQPGNVQLAAQYLLAHWDELLKIDGETNPNATEVHVSKDDVKKFLGIQEMKPL